MSIRPKSKRWNVVAIADGVEVKFVVRGDTELIAEKNAFTNYKGIASIVSITPREVHASFPTSDEALKKEPYQFHMRSEVRPQKRHSRKKLYG